MREGLALAKHNMSELISLCRQNEIEPTIIVYPGPIQIRVGDLNNLQVTTWKRFAAQEGVGMMNLFPAFFEVGAAEKNYKRFFIENDIHWSPAGHQLVATELSPIVSAIKARSRGGHGGDREGVNPSIR